MAEARSGRDLTAWRGHQAWPDGDTRRQSLALTTILKTPDPPQSSARYRNPLHDPDVLDLPLTDQQLAILSPAELAVLPRLIEARRGRPFKEEHILAYLGALSRILYRADEQYTPERLTATDRDNLERLARASKARGQAPSADELRATFVHLSRSDHT